MLRLGNVFCTQGALGAFAEALEESPDTFISRHESGDWGEVDAHDRQANEYAVAHGLRVLSAYRLGTGVKIWIITEADRSSTTILLPEEY